MLRFFFQKNFCDGWDNIFSLFIPNVISLLVIAGSYICIRAAANIHSLLALFVFLVCSGIVMIGIFSWGENAKKIADFDTPSLSSYFSAFPKVWKKGFAFGIICAVLFIVGRASLPYYLGMFKKGNIFGLLFAAVIFLFLFISVLSLQWFLPLMFLQEGNTFKKALKKSYIIFFDNPAFSFGIFLYNLILLGISFFLFLVIPGTAGISLSLMNALRLRLYKYDWLEDHPEIADDKDKRSEVPWNELIAEDKETLGPRTLSSFFFPWKN